jgi:uncharacterized oxidoreductase
MKLQGNTILITGGGSGIGAALAQRLHDAGNTVIVSGRRVDALQATITGRPRMYALPLDVADSVAIDAFAQDVRSAFPALNVVVHNAGILLPETLDARRELADAEAMITTNLLGPIRLTNALIDHLVGMDGATLITVTSALAFVPLTFAPTYCATKAALHSYTVALRTALKHRVEVIEIVPSGVQTALTPGQETRPGFQPLDEFANEVLALLTGQPTPAEVVVEDAKFLRNAEAEHRFDATVVQLNALETGAGAAQT